MFFFMCSLMLALTAYLGHIPSLVSCNCSCVLLPFLLDSTDILCLFCPLLPTSIGKEVGMMLYKIILERQGVGKFH